MTREVFTRRSWREKHSRPGKQCVVPGALPPACSTTLKSDKLFTDCLKLTEFDGPRTPTYEEACKQDRIEVCSQGQRRQRRCAAVPKALQAELLHSRLEVITQHVINYTRSLESQITQSSGSTVSLWSGEPSSNEVKYCHSSSSSNNNNNNNNRSRSDSEENSRCGTKSLSIENKLEPESLRMVSESTHIIDQSDNAAEDLLASEGSVGDSTPRSRAESLFGIPEVNGVVLPTDEELTEAERWGARLLKLRKFLAWDDIPLSFFVDEIVSDVELEEEEEDNDVSSNKSCDLRSRRREQHSRAAARKPGPRKAREKRPPIDRDDGRPWIPNKHMQTRYLDTSRNTRGRRNNVGTNASRQIPEGSSRRVTRHKRRTCMEVFEDLLSGVFLG